MVGYLDIKQLRYFVGIVEANGFSEAAKKLYVSQPTLSKAMKHLEENLGVQLIYMSGKKVQITDCGRQLYAMAKGVIEQHDSIFRAMHDLTSLQKGVIRVGIPPIIGTCVFPSLIAGFIGLYPGIEFQIDQHGAKHIQLLVDKGELDVGFTICPVITGAFDVVPVVEDKNVLVVSTQHQLAGCGRGRYEQLRNEKFVLLGEEYMLNSNIVNGCREAGFEPRVLVEASQWDFIVQLVKINMGISIIPRRILDMYPEPSIAQVDIEHPSSLWRVVMVTKKNQYLSFAVQTFVTYMKEQATAIFHPDFDCEIIQNP